MRSGIYAIECKANGRRYIGSAVNIAKRWKEHRRGLDAGTHHSRFLMREWNKRGPDAFIFSVLLYCSRDNLLMYEQACLDGFKPEYNTNPTAGSMSGFRHREDSRKKMSASNNRTGNPGHKHTQESKQKISENRKGKGGGPRSPERLAKISAALKGRIITAEQRSKISATLMGHKQSPEQIEKRMKKLRGRKMPDGFAAKASERMTGQKLTPCHCQNLGRAKARLSDDQARKVRVDRGNGVTIRQLSKQLNISDSSIKDIVSGKSYGWVI